MFSGNIKYYSRYIYGPSSHPIKVSSKIFQNEEGFDRIDLARELHRQRQLAQDKYLREIVAVLSTKHQQHLRVNVSVDALRRAFALVDPAIGEILTLWILFSVFIKRLYSPSHFRFYTHNPHNHLVILISRLPSNEIKYKYVLTRHLG